MTDTMRRDKGQYVVWVDGPLEIDPSPEVWRKFTLASIIARIEVFDTAQRVPALPWTQGEMLYMSKEESRCEAVAKRIEAVRRQYLFYYRQTEQHQTARRIQAQKGFTDTVQRIVDSARESEANGLVSGEASAILTLID